MAWVEGEHRDPKNLFVAIANSVQNTPAQKLFLSMMQHFLLIRDPPEIRYVAGPPRFASRCIAGLISIRFSSRAHRYQYWKLLERVVSQVIMDGKGIDPSFTGKYNINVGKIIEGFVKTEQARGFATPRAHAHSPPAAAAIAGEPNARGRGARIACSSSEWSRRCPTRGAGCAPSRKPRTSSTTSGQRTLVRARRS